MAEKPWKIRFHPETPIEVLDVDPFKFDFLSFRNSVISLSSLIQQIETPFTISIYGEWGSGKTSFLKMLRAFLNKDNKFTTFWFDSWQYENESSLFLPFLSKISNEIRTNRSSSSEIKRLVKSVKKIGTTLILTGGNMITKIGTLGTTDVDNLTKYFELYEKQYEKFYDSWVSEIDKFKIEFEKLINEINKDKHAIVFFIDDIDRCMPENSVKLIENIKHFLSVKGCIFILGVDKDALSKSIMAKYGTNLVNADEYLNKIINLSFEIPQRIDIDFSLTNFVINTSVKMAAPEWYESIKENLEIICRTIECAGIGHNPRKIRFVIQRLLLFLTLDNYKDYNLEKICILLILKEFFPFLYAFKEIRSDFKANPSDKAEQNLPRRDILAEYGSDCLKEWSELNKSQYHYLRDVLELFHQGINLNDYLKIIRFLYSLS